MTCIILIVHVAFMIYVAFYNMQWCIALHMYEGITLNGCECMIMINHHTCLLIGGLGTVRLCPTESHSCITWKNMWWVLERRVRHPSGERLGLVHTLQW